MTTDDIKSKHLRDGLTLYRSGACRHVGNDVIEIQSRSMKGRRYRVEPERGYCPCDAHQKGGHYCAHLIAAAYWMHRPVRRSA